MVQASVGAEACLTVYPPSCNLQLKFLIIMGPREDKFKGEAG